MENQTATTPLATEPVTPELALKQAKAKVGGNTGLAKLLSETRQISPQAVSQWKRVPVSHVMDVERLTGFSRHLLRPDIYGGVI